jgi:hypothetical protein
MRNVWEVLQGSASYYGRSTVWQIFKQTRFGMKSIISACLTFFFNVILSQLSEYKELINTKLLPSVKGKHLAVNLSLQKCLTSDHMRSTEQCYIEQLACMGSCACVLLQHSSEKVRITGSTLQK